MIAKIHFIRRSTFLAAGLMAGALFLPAYSPAQTKDDEVCWRGALGAAVPEPADLRSKNGELHVDLALRTQMDAKGQTRYCYVDAQGNQSPTLRAKPGDRVTLRLRNELPITTSARNMEPHVSPEFQKTEPQKTKAQNTEAHKNDCADSASGNMAEGMSVNSTNLHFHGLVLPPLCHQDDVLHTLIQPTTQPFQYSFQIPRDQSPGLYWYHPHVHGLTRAQILGGASGALVVEGIEDINNEVSALPERVLIIRDQELLNPDAGPVPTDSMPPPQVLKDAEGDILNNGTGAGKPAKDLSINFVPVPYPQYPPAMIAIKPQEKQLWRVLNASAITYLDLQLMYGGASQSVQQTVGVVAIDGVSINQNGNQDQRIILKKHVQIPPGGRAEFIVQGPKAGTPASLVTRTLDTGPAGENDPTRPLANIVAKADAPEPRSTLPVSPAVLLSSPTVPLNQVTPARQRKLYFSEMPRDPRNPNGPIDFYLTVDGKSPVLFDPSAPEPDIVVKQGDVEDWIVENRSQELHDFHIHQLHFQLLEWNSVPVNEPYLRDTINVPYWDGHSPVYPSVKLRMDFRDPAIVGTFVYHCHLLEHEDGGMMGTIRVELREATARASGKSTGVPASR